MLHSLLLLFSGVYYSVAILPQWMQFVSRFVPGTYILDGVRAGLMNGTPVTDLLPDVWPLLVMAVVLIPAGAYAFSLRRALRQAHRQAEEGRLMASDSRLARGVAAPRLVLSPRAAAGVLPAAKIRW